MTLSDTAIKNAKPLPDKDFKISDEKGMYLLVHKNGSKYFRLDYRFGGKRKSLALGVYPETTLKQAREKRDEAKKQISEGCDPSIHKKAIKASKALNGPNSFEVIAREWFSIHMDGKAKSHTSRTMAMLERDIFPMIGAKNVDVITTQEMSLMLRYIQDRGAIETAHRALQVCGQVIRYANQTGRAEKDITPKLKGSLKPVVTKNFAAITTPKEAAKLLRAIDAYEGTHIVKSALQLAPLVFVRPGELRQAKWKEIDFDKKEWRFFVTKTKTDHIVPLSTQSLDVLNRIKPFTENGTYVFPSARTTDGSRPMSDVALTAALRRMGISKDETTIHGFRALARTILDEELGFRPDFIEHQLAHAVRDPNGRAYNRTAHLEERRKMMQVWADYLDKIKTEL